MGYICNMLERLNKLLELEELSSSQFADRLGVQRSGISHILNGRNKPSLDLISKILRSFPDINPDWLILGIGEPYRNRKGNEDRHQSTLFDQKKKSDQSHKREKGLVQSLEKEVVKVLVLYSDNTFEVYEP